MTKRHVHKGFTAMLSCGHSMTFAKLPRYREEVVCRQCPATVNTRGVLISAEAFVAYVMKYTAECYDCTYVNHEGNPTVAERRGRKHCEDKQHRVRLIYPNINTPVVLIPSNDQMLELAVSA